MNYKLAEDQVRKSWTTKDELMFCRSLGSHGEKRNARGDELRWKYLDAMDKRENWGDIDKREVRRALEKWLA